MKASIYFLVEVENTYNNYIEISKDVKFSVNNTIDSMEHINRVGKFIDGPKGSIVSPGDFLLFHHNICRESFGKQGKRRKSVFNVKDNIFYIPATEIFMVMKKSSDQWEALDPYTFIKPIPAEKQKLPNGFELKEESYKNMKPLMGILEYPNKKLLELGAKKGDIIAFQENSEHEFEIKGEIFYKMKTRDILAIL